MRYAWYEGLATDTRPTTSHSGCGIAVMVDLLCSSQKRLSSELPANLAPSLRPIRPFTIINLLLTPQPILSSCPSFVIQSPSSSLSPAASPSSSPSSPSSTSPATSSPPASTPPPAGSTS